MTKEERHWFRAMYGRAYEYSHAGIARVWSLAMYGSAYEYSHIIMRADAEIARLNAANKQLAENLAEAHRANNTFAQKMDGLLELEREKALEEAAKIAEQEYQDRSKGAEVRHKASKDISARIRALAATEPKEVDDEAE